MRRHTDTRTRAHMHTCTNRHIQIQIRTHHAPRFTVDIVAPNIITVIRTSLTEPTIYVHSDVFEDYC